MIPTNIWHFFPHPNVNWLRKNYFSIRVWGYDPMFYDYNDWTDCLPHLGFLFAALIPMKTLRRDQWSLRKPNCSACFFLVNPDKTKKCFINLTTSTIRIQHSSLLNQLKLGTSAPMRPRATKSKAYSWWSMHGSILKHVDPPNNG